MHKTNKQRKIIETYQIRDGSFNWTADKYVAAEKKTTEKSSYADMLPTGVCGVPRDSKNTNQKK